MTLGDVFEKVGGVFGAKPKSQRKLEKKIAETGERLKAMEDEQNAVLRKNSAVGAKIDELKARLRAETNPHNQDILMDRVDGLEKEFTRNRELARQKSANIDAQRAVRSRLEQLLEQLRNGADEAEIEGLIDQVEMLGEDRRTAKGLVDRLDAAAAGGSSSSTTETPDDAEAERRRARLAAMLGTGGSQFIATEAVEDGALGATRPTNADATAVSSKPSYQDGALGATRPTNADTTAVSSKPPYQDGGGGLGASRPTNADAAERVPPEVATSATLPDSNSLAV